MHDHSGGRAVIDPGVDALLLIGNPNVGKSVVFGHLTGRYATVSNYPGTTVEIAAGTRRGKGGVVLDLPGANTLVPSSEDEQVTRDVLLERAVLDQARVVQVCDAKNLRRGLLLTIQLAELEVPTVLVANMMDECHARGIDLLAARLSEELGIEVLETIATEGVGLSPLLSDEVQFRAPRVTPVYAPPIEAAALEVQTLLPASLRGRRGLALMLLAGEASAEGWARMILGGQLEAISATRERLERLMGEPAGFAISRARLAAADRVVERVVKIERAASEGWLARLGRLSMHPLWGLPIAAITLYAMYLFVGVIGAGTAVNFLENVVFAKYLTPFTEHVLRALSPASVESFLVGPAGHAPGKGPGLLIGDYGLVSMGLSYAVAIVLPIVGFFFLAFAVLEDSGYLPRLAVLLNRAFKLMGLNGKAVLPMILGLGCDTMATLTARILPTRKERLLVTLLLALGVPCSAQLGVVMAMLSALSLRATLVWLSAVLGVMLLVGYVAGRLLPGDVGDFILEIPPMRRPVFRNILIKTVARIEWYLREAVPLFLVGTLVLWIADRLSLLRLVERISAPVVTGILGLPPQATNALVLGFLRRDYGAAGLYDLFNGKLHAGVVAPETEIQVVVSMVTITLFVPCVANFMVIVKERGWKTALAMTAFIFPFAITVGGLLNLALRAVAM